MKYYKIIVDNQIIGVATSNNFIAYQPITGCFLLADEETGEYIEYKNQIYRSTWMQPIQKNIPFIPAFVMEITEEEYHTFDDLIQKNEVIYHELKEEQPQEIEQFIPREDTISIDFIRTSKLNEMSYTCRTTIENGFDLILRGETHHFSLDTQDQLNLMSLSAMAQTEELIPYHADGEECIFYTADEINQIVAAANQFKIYHTTYYNALKSYINSLETIEEISQITYGVSIPDEYKTDVLKELETKMLI